MDKDLITVRLRNGWKAHVRAAQGSPYPFTLQGEIMAPEGRTIDLWQHSGSWREDGSNHPLDIIGVLDGAGVLHALQNNTLKKAS
jgi:hypothetical protein